MRSPVTIRRLSPSDRHLELPDARSDYSDSDRVVPASDEGEAMQRR
jgi:hypothetical protein